MTRPLVLFGGVAVAVVSIGHQVLSAILTHRFSVGHDFSDHAVEFALTRGTANTISNYLDLVAVLALAAGMIAAMVGAMRVGLLTRWMGVLGIFTGVLIFLPIGGNTLEIVPAFWITAMGMLYAERWPGGDPPAWTSGKRVHGPPGPINAPLLRPAMARCSWGPAVISGRHRRCPALTALPRARASASADVARAAAKGSGRSRPVVDLHRCTGGPAWARTAHGASVRWPGRMILPVGGWLSRLLGIT